ncbi:acyl transferase domain-containing protein [Aquimarina sp. MAR_2010_214]|uniref:type I polyketide synthase n=1 Tax=Aquimarina sp. MAR_2010_214 TaxID=1250026 RepID=UPI000C70C921|nr:type I polyketide synthase [Aquimarina sp. MAR_2010_214]PKV49526.1 acyl transferase domain-containing protein [Aquimarina sp. MAR_2010_214]
MKELSRKKDIAIVGVSGKFPQSDNIQLWWDNLAEGKELVHFYSDQELQTAGVNEETLAKDNYIKAGSFIDNPEHFDHAFFGYTKEEAALMDPQVRVMHEQVWKALEDAGCELSTYQGKIGLYLAASDNVNWKAYETMNQNEKVSPFFSARLADKNFISTLISYRLDLKGPSLFVDTACSGSLVAVHMACRNLLLKECNIAIAGGVSIDSTIYKGYFHESGMIASKDGHCKTFDHDASGTVWGEGAGAVVLKRWEDAIRDKDNIYAIIRATAVNNDGRRKVGFTAPSVEGQYDCIKMAHKVAGITTDSISYIEAHGTGTRLGDPIEITALNQAFGYKTQHKCAIGSVKTNMGHLDAAAGIAGLLKTCLALKNKQLPPSLNFSKPNPEIDFASGPFEVNTQLRPWNQKNGMPRRAGVSSFGIGGTNAHVILEEASEEKEEGKQDKPFQLLAYSADSLPSLQQYGKELIHFLKKKKVSLPNLSYTLQDGRQRFKHRQFIVCKDQQDAIEQLSQDNRQIISRKDKLRKVVTFMFPGQGSQYFQMGRDLYEKEPLFKEFMDQGFQILKQITGEDYAVILGYQEVSITNPDQINFTEYTQPLLFLISHALANYLMKLSIHPNHMIGHSLGEYVAACISGVFSLEDGLKIIVKRAQLMSQVEKGDMLGVGANVEEVQSLMSTRLSIASINTKSSCVVSGMPKDISELSTILTNRDIPYTKLKTSHAFHSGMMDSILKEYETILSQVQWNTPKQSFISNLYGREIRPEEAMSPAYWVKHLRETVRFSEGLEYLMEKGNGILIEVGPGRTLTSLAKQNQTTDHEHTIVNLLRHPKEKVDDNNYLTKALGQLWSYGMTIDWKVYHQNNGRLKISIPTYVFDEVAFPARVNPFNEKDSGMILSQGVNRSAYYSSNWKKGLLSKKQGVWTKNNKYLVFSSGSPLVQVLIKELKNTDNMVIVVEKATHFEAQVDLIKMDPKDQTHYTKLFQSIEKQESIAQIIYNWEIAKQEEGQLFSEFFNLFSFGMGLVRYAPLEDKKLTFLSDFGLRVIATEHTNVNFMAVKSISQSFRPVHSKIFTCSLDMDQNQCDKEHVAQLLAEIRYNSSESEVAYRHGIRWLPFYEELRPDNNTGQSQLTKKGIYLFIGEADPLSLQLAKHLCQTYDATVVFAGSEFPDQETWETDRTKEGLPNEMAQKLQEQQEFKTQGDKILYWHVDNGNVKHLSSTIDRINDDFGVLAGIIYTQAETLKNINLSATDLDKNLVTQRLEESIKGFITIWALKQQREVGFLWIPAALNAFFGQNDLSINAVFDAYVQAYLELHAHQLDDWFQVYINESGFESTISTFEDSLRLPSGQTLWASSQNPSVLQGQDLEILESSTETIKNNTERPTLSVVYQAPCNEVENGLCKLWSSFFGYEQIGVNDDFFELGGDSLKAMSLLQRIHQQFGIEVGLQDFYEKANIAALGVEIELANQLIAVQKQENKRKTIKI